MAEDAFERYLSEIKGMETHLLTHLRFLVIVWYLSRAEER